MSKSSNSRPAKGKGRASIWTDELVEQLLALWEQGLSASTIAQQLGHGLTRNAVIGKIHRLRAAGKAPARREQQKSVPAGAATGAHSKAARPASAAPLSATGATTAGALALQARREKLPTVEQMRDTALELVVDGGRPSLEQGLVADIMELNPRTCRWPIGDPGEEDFCYCGREAATGLPYCEHHARRAYSSVSEARRRAG